MTTFTFILRGVPEPAKAPVATLLGKAFSLKDSTCVSIASSAPIILLPDLTREEAAAMHVVLAGFSRLGAEVEFSTNAPDELPKIDWPRRPQVFKREISDYIQDYQLAVPLPGGGRERLINLLLLAFPGGAATGSNPMLSGSGGGTSGSRPSSEFRGMNLPEITPFGGVSTLKPSTTNSAPNRPAVPISGGNGSPQQPPALSGPGVAGANGSSGKSETISRLNELFPEEDGNFGGGNADISSILNKLLPDEEARANATPGMGSAAAGPGSTAGAPGVTTASRPSLGTGGGSGGHPATGHAVFLAKIADEGRRQKAVPLIAELAKITVEEAENLSKKVIIPVLKGATQAEADSAKQRFAKIGILARVKGPE